MDGFTALDVRPDMGATPWDDLPEDGIVGHIERIGLLPNGTTKGRASVAIAVRMPNGEVIIAETTWRLLGSAVRALDLSPQGQHEAEHADD